jgi:hypothetical protein
MICISLFRQRSKGFSESIIHVKLKLKCLLFLPSLVAVIMVSACSSNSTESQSPSQATEFESILGTNGELISIESDNVRLAGYDANSQTMTVEFDDGQRYEYYGVPAGLWNAFIEAQPHPWSAVGYPQLVSGGYSYQRVN